MAFLKSLGGEQPDYMLNGLLRVGADPDFKIVVILGVAANQSYLSNHSDCSWYTVVIRSIIL